MKIIYFTDTFLPAINGVVTSVKNFSQRLAQRGHLIFIFTTQAKECEDMEFGKGVKVKYFKSTSKLIKYPDFKISYPNTYKTYQEIKKFQPEIIHIHTPSPQAWSIITVARRSKIPVAASYHTYLPEFIKHTVLARIDKKEILKEAAKQYTRLFYNLVDQVIVPSEVIKDELIAQGVKKSITAVSNGVNVDLFTCKDEKQKNENPKLLYVGRVSYEKNIDVILRALAVLKKKSINVTLDIVGSGPDLENLQKLSHELGVEDLVVFRGPIEHEKLKEIYCNHDIFITASTIETEGLVILEAMASGLPIIGVDKLAIPILVKHRVNGLISEPGNAQKMADNVLELINEKEKIVQYSKKSIEICQDYTLEKSIEKIENIYSEIIKNI
jgi:glycosyltransferase involved in cell wall biosynthesis